MRALAVALTTAGAEEKLIPLAGVNIGAGLFLVLASTIMAENGG